MKEAHRIVTERKTEEDNARRGRTGTLQRRQTGLLNGPTSSTDENYMDRCSCSYALFFGIGHRMRKEKMEDTFNKDAGQQTKKNTDEKSRQ